MKSGTHAPAPAGTRWPRTPRGPVASRDRTRSSAPTRMGAAVGVGLPMTARAGREHGWSTHPWTHHIGMGQERFEAASVALLTWHMHRCSGAWVDPDTPSAAPGQHMLSSLGIGPFRLPEPCVVLEVVQTPEQTVMHYQALSGHALEGEERFTISWGPDRSVTFEVIVHSRPALLLPRLAGPLVSPIQWLFIARCASVR